MNSIELMKYKLIISIIIGLFTCASATILRVPDDYDTIQEAIDAAVDGDTVIVADGTYAGVGNRDIDFFGKAIVVMSENGPEKTIVDCEGSEQDPHRGFYFHSGEDSNSVVKGFTIKNGYRYTGGGILCNASSPSIICNIITENTADGGGGIMCRNGGDAIIMGNTITRNTAGSCGGAVYCYNNSSPIINNNIIAENIGYICGGGVRCGFSSPSITGNTFSKNIAEYGGAISCLDNSSPTVVNCILWEDSATFGKEIFKDGTSSITVTYSDIRGSWSGQGNIDADPLFVTGLHGDFYLSQIASGQPQQSPCVDTGDPNSHVPDGTTRTDEVWDVWPTDMGYHYLAYMFGVGEQHKQEIDTPVYHFKNYPNPFQTFTTISYFLETRSYVTLEIYDIKGALVRTLVSGNISAGQNSVIWDGSNFRSKTVSSGVYFCYLSVNGHVEKKCVIFVLCNP